MNLFWLFLILRIAKNYAFSNVRADERSDDEEDDEEDDNDEEVKVNTKDGVQANGRAKMNGSNPVVLVNGEPLEAQSKSNGVRERRKKG